MPKRNDDSSEHIVPCAQSLKEVPVSETKIFEAVDYVAYFCGPECYSKWATQDEDPEWQRSKD
ncbi:MAG: DUF3330 domain-containing protein [Rhodoferax sp.]|uniref:DUF3330 domain-containing protein n=1 Tax=Rhodoferax sp. TaxID=50421 RepID=UPI00140161DF|nr:DUF3330 domain-containing protein [Rhodoferax sp.]